MLTAGGRIFSAGVDLLRVSEGGAPYIRKFLPALSTMLSTVFSYPTPVVAAISGHAIAGGCVLACAADRRLMARDGGRIGVTELLVGVPFPPVPMEIMRCATTPQFFADALFSGATYLPPAAVERGWVHDVVEEQALLDRAIGLNLRCIDVGQCDLAESLAHALAALPPQAFALSKRQIRQPALDRMKDPVLDAAVERIWTAPESIGSRDARGVHFLPKRDADRLPK